MTGSQTKGGRSRRWNRVALITVVMTPIVLASCQLPTFGMYRGATRQANDTLKLWQGFMIASFVVGGIVAVLIFWAIVRYRRRSEDIPRQTQYHIPLEISYTIVPIVIVLGLFVFTVITENNVDATPPHPQATVNVTAFQWGWRFAYPGKGVVVQGETTEAPQMVIPANRRVRINLASADVIHGFYVPQFNFSRYAQPGYTNTFDLNVNHEGTFRGQCSQLCGLYHSLMLFSVKAVSPSQYQTWLVQKRRQELTSASGQAANTKGAP